MATHSDAKSDDSWEFALVCGLISTKASNIVLRLCQTLKIFGIVSLMHYFE